MKRPPERHMEPETLESSISFLQDGRVVTMDFGTTAAWTPTTTVLHYLRSLPGHTGTKEGCAEGDCGACTVVLAEPAGSGLRYTAINSCLVFLPMLHGKQLITVESMRAPSGELHPVQQALVDAHGSQCGFCTPGIVMSLFALCKNAGSPSEADIRRALLGNLCRCTGYASILEAAHRVCRAAIPDRFDEEEPRSAEILRSLPRTSRLLATTEQQYFRPVSLREALEWKQEHPAAVVLNGATDIALRVTKRFELLPSVLDLSAVTELRTISDDGNSTTLGAGVSLQDLLAFSGDRLPALHGMLDVFGSKQIRSLATVGGNLATASPIGDTIPVMIAHKATVILRSVRGERRIPASDFVIGYRRTACTPDELLTGVALPHPDHDTLLRSYKVSRRRDLDISTVSACFRLEYGHDSQIAAAILAFGGMADHVARATRTEEFLIGKQWNRRTAEEAAVYIDRDFTPLSDVRGSSDFRRVAARNLLMKFWGDTAADAGGRRPEETSAARGETGTMSGHIPHESAELHVSGEALFIDDVAVDRQALIGKVVISPHAHARIVTFDLTAARSLPGVHAVLSARDIPGENQMGPVVPDEPCLAEGEVTFVGQAVFLIAAETEDACRRAEALITVRYEPLDAHLTLDEAMAAHALLGMPRSMGHGDVDEALRSAPHVLSGELRTGAQEHWYLESQVSLCLPGEQNEVIVHSSTQNPSETQALVAEVLALTKKDVVVEVRRIGGGFGGKETQANHVACWAALLCRATKRPVKIRLRRDEDMIMTGKRHRFLSRYSVGFDDEGRLLAAQFELNSDAGAATDLSHAIMERAMLHCDNAYSVPRMSVTARVWKTHLPPNTAFRGFGGPQGMALVESVIDRVARHLHLDPATVRSRNFYGTDSRNVTHYGQTVEHNRLPLLFENILRSSDYERRRHAIAAFNAQTEFVKRGIALTPVKFGISFTTSFLNQAGALVLVYDDGTVLVNHGGTEMGQGVHTKIRQIAAAEFGVPLDHVKVTATNTSKVPNTPPTAASTGTDLNGAAVKNAIDTLKGRISAAVAVIFSERWPAPPTLARDILYCNGELIDSLHPDRHTGFGETMALLRLRQVSLSATGYYRTPGIGWDKNKGEGRPFHYYAFGIAVSEVEVDTLTGRVLVLRTDILHDAGSSLNRGIDMGQVRGGFLQGVGWVTTEEIVWDADGHLLTHSPDTYKIPTANDVPLDFRVSLLEGVPNPGVIGGSKAVGEPPFMLALSVWLAIKDALAAIGGGSFEPEFSLPATSEVILLSADRQRLQLRNKAAEAAPR